MLRDHFHSPLVVRRHWHSFHNAWATYLASALNNKLPDGFFAEPNVQFGIEIDVATWEDGQDGKSIDSAEANSAASAAIWTPPAPSKSISFAMQTDTVEIAIYGTESGPTLVGAIELVSPANKDRPENREAFVAKCESYLQHGIGLVVVDVVTSRAADLHAALLARLGTTEDRGMNAVLFASAYRPVGDKEHSTLDIWFEHLAIGQPLPTMPLYLRNSICVPVDLDGSYEHTCREQRIA